MHLNPTAGFQISTLIFENKLWRGGLYKYPMKSISRMEGETFMEHAMFVNISLKLVKT